MSCLVGRRRKRSQALYQHVFIIHEVSFISCPLQSREESEVEYTTWLMHLLWETGGRRRMWCREWNPGIWLSQYCWRCLPRFLWFLLCGTRTQSPSRKGLLPIWKEKKQNYETEHNLDFGPSFLTWLEAMVIAAADVKPAITGNEMKSITNPAAKKILHQHKKHQCSNKSCLNWATPKRGWLFPRGTWVGWRRRGPCWRVPPSWGPWWLWDPPWCLWKSRICSRRSIPWTPSRGRTESVPWLGELNLPSSFLTTSKIEIIPRFPSARVLKTFCQRQITMLERIFTSLSE